MMHARGVTLWSWAAGCAAAGLVSVVQVRTATAAALPQEPGEAIVIPRTLAAQADGEAQPADAQPEPSEVGVSMESAIVAPPAFAPIVLAPESVPQAVPADTGPTRSAPILDVLSSRVSFQALLLDDGGVALPDGPVALEFNIYICGGGLVEGPIPVAATVANGVVSTQVPVSAASFDGNCRELGVTVNPPEAELSPRIPLTATPYAFRVDRVASPELDDDIELGSIDANGELTVWSDSSNVETIELDGGAHRISTFGSDGLEQVRLWGPTWGELQLFDNVGNHQAVLLSANNDAGGVLQLNDGTGGSSLTLSGAAGNIDSEGDIAVVTAIGGTDVAKLYQVLSGVNGGRLETYSQTGLYTGIFGSSTTAGGVVELRQADESLGAVLDGDADATNGGGLISLYQANGSTLGARIDGDASNNNGGGEITAFQIDGGIGAVLDGDSGGAGLVSVRDLNGNSRVNIDGDANSAAGGGVITAFQADGSTGVVMDGDASNGNTGGAITVHNNLSSTRVEILGEGLGAGGEISLFDNDGHDQLILRASESTTQGAEILLKNEANVVTIQLDADVSGTGDGRVITQELQITGGSDLSEQFDIDAAGGKIEPGMVVSIDPTRPGELSISSQAHDRRVAGIVSGAGGVKPGLWMGQRGTPADGAHPVALTGRAYAWCDATRGAIEPGDLLTTSDAAGHAMKVNDHAAAQGAIIGKAMTPLKEGKGLVLVLVSLQ